MIDRNAVSYSIRQLCQEFGCTPRALRFYEDKGLLKPQRDGLNRVYSYRDRARLQLILRGKRLRLSLDEIRQILDLYKEGGSTAAQDAVTLRKYRERIVALEEQRLDLDTAIAELEAGCKTIEKRLAASGDLNG